MRAAALKLGLALLLVSASSCAPLIARAQQAGKVYRIGYLTVPSRETAQDGAKAFESGLRDLGWVENVVVEYRFADNDLDRLPDLATELVRLRVDVIAAGATPAVMAAKNATRTVPIVMFLPGNPVGSGLVASLARPGGNITGLAGSAGPEIYGKQLQLLKDTFPRISRVAILVNRATKQFHALGLRQTEIAARALGVQYQVIEVRDPREFDSAFAALTTARWTPCSFLPIPVFNTARGSLTLRRRRSRRSTAEGACGGWWPMAYSPVSLT
jgi:putative ABC transport system substrate-binding protein